VKAVRLANLVRTPVASPVEHRAKVKGVVAVDTGREAKAGAGATAAMADLGLETPVAAQYVRTPGLADFRPVVRPWLLMPAPNRPARPPRRAPLWSRRLPWLKAVPRPERSTVTVTIEGSAFTGPYNV
jgi:hypothetical protein